MVNLDVKSNRRVKFEEATRLAGWDVIQPPKIVGTSRDKWLQIAVNVLAGSAVRASLGRCHRKIRRSQLGICITWDNPPLLCGWLPRSHSILSQSVNWDFRRNVFCDWETIYNNLTKLIWPWPTSARDVLVRALILIKHSQANHFLRGKFVTSGQVINTSLPLSCLTNSQTTTINIEHGPSELRAACWLY